MRVNGIQMRKKMEEVFKCGLMDLFMKDTGKMIKQTEEAV